MRFRVLIFAITLLPVGLGLAQVASAVPRTIADVTEMLDRHRPDPAAIMRFRETLATKAPEGASRDTEIKFHERQAQAAAGLGLVTRVLQERRQLVALTEGQNNQPKHLIDLAISEITAGNWTEAEKYARRAATASSGWWGQDILSMMLLARMQSWLGDVTSARTQTDTSEDEFRRGAAYPPAPQFADLVAALIAWSKGDTQLADGKAIAGEASLLTAARRALADTKSAEQRSRYIEWAPAPDSTWQLLDLIEAQLARVHSQQGHQDEAELVARAMLLRNLNRLGRESPSTAVSLAVLGEVLIAQQRWREAAALADLAAATLERAGAKVTSGYAYQAERVRIDSRLGIGDWKGATALIDSLRVRLGDETTMMRATERRGIWALALVRQGRAPEAEVWLARLLEEHAQVYGKDRYETAETSGLLGVALASQGKLQQAYEAFVIAIPVLVTPARGSEADAEDGLRRITRRAILEAWIGLLYSIQGSDLAKAKGIDAAAEAFRIGDSMRGGNLQSAVAASAARAMAGTPQLGDLIRHEQDSKREIVTMNNRLGALALTPDSDIRNKAVSDIRSRIRVIEAGRTDLFRQIESQFPAYANLIRPQPPTLAETRAVLRPAEALINVFTTETTIYLWAFKKEGPVAFVRASINREEWAGLVHILRKALDPGPVDLATRIPEFDLDSAYRLYAELLAPVASGWQGATHLLVVANGALDQLPLAVLPTERTTVKPDAILPYGHFKDVPWLIRQAAFTQLPSVNTLLTLRKLPVASAQRSPFVGFGDPQFANVPVQLAGTLVPVDLAGTRALRNLALARPSQQDIEQDKPVDWIDYGQIPALPDTRVEILALARALKADLNKDVFLGSQASKANLKKLELSNRRVVAFATHGLLPGDFPGVSEPALALANPGGGQHGLLTLEDILALKLDADWVVLSACNTAAGDGQGADAISGLGRGFFYAGTRALLVTHWPVESVSARLLVTDIFERQAADANLSRADALRQSMLALMQQNSDSTNAFAYAHPLFWAPYILVGEGGI